MVLKLLTTSLCIFLLHGITFSQEDAIVQHTIKKHSERNEYEIKSAFAGIENAEFAKIKFIIPSGVKIITPSKGGSVAKKEEDGISFYALSFGSNGVETIFYIQPDQGNEITIKIQFAYALGEQKIKPIVKDLVIEPTSDFVAYEGDQPEDKSFEINNFEKEDSSIENEGENKGIYSIQLLSLTEYSDERVMKFCLEHNIDNGAIIKRVVNGLTKVSIGKYYSKDKAVEARSMMISNDAVLNDAFIVKLQ